MATKIGIFDSGSGGLSTLAAIRELSPDAEYYYIGDVAHCPYGTKTPAELLEINSAVVSRLQNWGAQIIVIACNTATTRCIHQLRQRFPDITFVGTEPALKVAHDCNFRHPLLLCTPATARANSVKRLVTQNYPNSPLLLAQIHRIRQLHHLMISRSQFYLALVWLTLSKIRSRIPKKFNYHRKIRCQIFMSQLPPRQPSTPNFKIYSITYQTINSIVSFWGVRITFSSPNSSKNSFLTLS